MAELFAWRMQPPQLMTTQLGNSIERRPSGLSASTRFLLRNPMQPVMVGVESNLLTRRALTL